MSAPEQPEDAYPVAYCAPGNRAIAELILAACGEQVARIAEHPWLEGTEGIYVVAEDPMDLTKQLPVRYEFPEQPFPLPDLNWRYGALVNTPRQMAILPAGLLGALPWARRAQSSVVGSCVTRDGGAL